ncbi:MAG: hypothetical protein RLZZ175_96 [Bacteroidota bacterium]|jgi:hypothetical protein
MKKQSIVCILLISLLACDKVKEKTKQTINEGGEVVGKTATEFVEGVSEGIDKTLECKIELQPSVSSAGLKTGSFSIQSDSTGGKNNLLTIYFIFDKDFKKEVLVKAFDKSGLEIGRSKQTITAKAGEAKYFDFKFDKRTYIEAKSKITVE